MAMNIIWRKTKCLFFLSTCLTEWRVLIISIFILHAQGEIYIFRGMSVTSGSVTLQKDDQNLVGISIGGGAPFCPCLYVVQVFDNTPAARDGTLASGDELTGINGTSVKGRTKVEVARMIQGIKVLHFIKMYLHV